MTKSAPEDSPVAQALRAAGFVPCPRWWITRKQMAVLADMARQHADQVNAIRANVRQNNDAHRQRQIDAAWAAHQESE